MTGFRSYRELCLAHGKVYMVLAPDAALVKIGTSLGPESRRIEIGYEIRMATQLVAQAPGSFQIERELHRRYAAHRVAGEWFVWNDRLEALARNFDRRVREARRAVFPAEPPAPPHQPE